MTIFLRIHKVDDTISPALVIGFRFIYKIALISGVGRLSNGQRRAISETGEDFYTQW